jgi:hypothetical protein
MNKKKNNINHVSDKQNTLRRKISAYCVKTFKKPVNLNFK